MLFKIRDIYTYFSHHTRNYISSITLSSSILTQDVGLSILERTLLTESIHESAFLLENFDTAFMACLDYVFNEGYSLFTYMDIIKEVEYFFEQYKSFEDENFHFKIFKNYCVPEINVRCDTKYSSAIVAVLLYEVVINSKSDVYIEAQRSVFNIKASVSNKINDTWLIFKDVLYDNNIIFEFDGDGISFIVLG